MKQTASGVEKLSFTTGPHYLEPQPGYGIGSVFKERASIGSKTFSLHLKLTSFSFSFLTYYC